MQKTKIYSVYTELFKPVWEIYEASVRKFSADLEPTSFEISTFGGLNRSTDWQQCVDTKQQMIFASIRENLGKIIIWSDCDVVFVNNPIPEINQCMEGMDICGFNDGRNYLYLNSGLLALRCSDKLTGMWSKLTSQPIHSNSFIKSPPDTNDYDQFAINWLLQSNKDIKYAFLPESFWCHHRGNPPDDICAFHATTFSLKEKISLLKNTDWLTLPKTECEITAIWNPEDIEIADDCTFWFFGIEDQDKHLCIRKDINQPEIMSKSTCEYTVKFKTHYKPYKWIIWPYSKSRGWLKAFVKTI